METDTNYGYLDDEVQHRSPDSNLSEEKSVYGSDLKSPLLWEEPDCPDLDDSDEERKIKESWFDFVKTRRLGKNWKDYDYIKISSYNNSYMYAEVHDTQSYHDWVKRKNLKKRSFAYAIIPWEKWKEKKENAYRNEEKLLTLKTQTLNFQERKTYDYRKSFQPVPKKPDLVIAPKKPDLVIAPKKPDLVIAPKKPDLVITPTEVKEKEKKYCGINNNNLSPFKNDKNFNFNIDSPPLEQRKAIFKNPSSGTVRLIRPDSDAIISAELEGKRIDVMFYKWNFVPRNHEKLTVKDSLQAFLRVGQKVCFHGARTIPGTNVYETRLVYEDQYPTLVHRSGYNLKKWFNDKDIYAFPRIAVVKTLLYPYHAAIDIDRPSRNSLHQTVAIMVDDLFVNKDDAAHVEGWIDDFIKPGDKIFVQLQYLKDKSVSVKKAWKFPEEEIIYPRKTFIPRNLPAGKFLFSCKEGKMWNGTVREVYEEYGIFLTSVKDKVYNVYFNQLFINGNQYTLNEIRTGDEICFSQFRLTFGNDYWCPRIWIGYPPSVGSLIKKYDEQNKSAVVDCESVYAGKVVDFILPSHAILKAKANNKSDIYILLSKNEIIKDPLNAMWIDKFLKINDVLTFTIKTLSHARYAAVQVCSCTYSCASAFKPAEVC